MGNEMYHYGILGMRWGVRRSIRQLRRNRRRKLKAEEQNRKLQQEMLKKSVQSSERLAKTKTSLADMSDEDLLAKKNRLTLERDVQRLLNDLDEDHYTKALNKRISTIKTENEYRSLVNPTPKNKSLMERGKALLLDDILPSVGKKAASAVIDTGIRKATSKAFIEDTALTSKSLIDISKKTLSDAGLEKNDTNMKYVMNYVKNKK